MVLWTAIVKREDQRKTLTQILSLHGYEAEKAAEGNGETEQREESRQDFADANETVKQAVAEEDSSAFRIISLLQPGTECSFPVSSTVPQEAIISGSCLLILSSFTATGITGTIRR